ncbi:MAG: DUF6077 domain-containing protein [Erysipelotrichaceae bacterium]
MINYLKGICILLTLISTYQLLGMAISKSNKQHGYNFVIGFFAYTALLASVGIFLQLLNSKWIYFLIISLLLWLAIIIFIVYSIKKKRIILNKEFFSSYLKTTIVVLLAALVVFFITMQSPAAFWINNMTDGGFYINRMANLPYLPTLSTFDPITGLEAPFSLSYSLNTFELESSLYIFLTNISSTVYARCFLAFLNIYVFLNIYNVFCEFIFSKWQSQYKNLVFTCFSASFYLMLGICIGSYLTNVEEAWRLATAVYFGSSFCMAIAPFALCLPVMDRNIKGFLRIFCIGVVCLTLVSRSSVAIPIIVLFALIYGFYQILHLVKNKLIKTVLVIIYFISLMLIGLILEKLNLVPFVNYELFLSMVSNILSVVVLIIFVISVYFIQDKNIKLLFYCILFGILVFLFIPVLQNIIFTASEFYFVYHRLLITLELFIYFVAFVLLYVSFIKVLNKHQTQVILALATLVLCFAITCHNREISLGSIRKTAAVYFHNSEIISRTTTKLAETLENYYKETKETLYAIVPNGSSSGDYGHIISSIVRYKTPHTIVVSGTLRIYQEYHNEGNMFDGFTLQEQNIIESLSNDSDQATQYQAANILSKYPINCVVLPNSHNNSSEVMSKLGFFYVSSVTDNDYELFSMYVRK